MRPSSAYDHAPKIDSPPCKRMIPKSGVRFSDKIMRRKGRRSAERRMPTMSAHTGKRHRLPMLKARLRATIEGAPAFRRFTAALATGYYPDGSAPEPGFLKTRRTGCFAPSPQSPRVKHAPCGPVLLPADRCPRAARERIAFIRARAPRPAPSSESALAKGALGKRDFCCVTIMGTIVKTSSP
jgi:hypothetical protein